MTNKTTRLLILLLTGVINLPAIAQRRLNLPSEEQIMNRVPEGVTFIPNIAYRQGNEAWKLDLAMPEERGNSPRPAIVFVHGGGWRNGDKRANSFLKPTLDYAAKGYVCITVNYRLQKEEPRAINECVEDVKNAVRWLRAHAKEYNVDPDRIGASGNSAGAHLSAMLGVCPPSAGLEGDGPYQEYSSMVQAVAASATPTSFLIPMSDRARQGVEREQTQADSQQTELRKRISPMTYVSGETPPILLFHEASDRTVGVYQSDNFIKALREAGAKDVNYFLLGDGTGHGTFQRNIAITEPAREAFFNRVLKPKE
jgi:acetyl esterase/lipase